jgi:hypothetical protein
MLVEKPLATESPDQELSENDRFLIQKTEDSIRDGLQLERWWREHENQVTLFPLNLKKKYQLQNRAEGFFSELSINGASRTVMGARQTVEFGKLTGPRAPERLREFVLAQFLGLSHWTYDDGEKGGFTFEKCLFKTAEGEYGACPTSELSGPMSWHDIGPKYAWVLLLVHIHDFVLEMGPLKLRVREAAYVAPNPGFVHIVENPSPEYALEVSIGYPFVDVAPFPNLFGFGPGKFGAAIKLFSFFLTTKQEVRVRMLFAAAPRAQKVFDFGKRFPDPIYGGAQLLHYMTAGLFSSQGVRDRMDAGMLVTHCQVHQALMEGAGKVWQDWTAANP